MKEVIIREVNTCANPQIRHKALILGYISKVYTRVCFQHYTMAVVKSIEVFASYIITYVHNIQAVGRISMAIHSVLIYMYIHVWLYNIARVVDKVTIGLFRHYTCTF